MFFVSVAKHCSFGLLYLPHHPSSLWESFRDSPSGVFTIELVQLQLGGLPQRCQLIGLRRRIQVLLIH